MRRPTIWSWELTRGILLSWWWQVRVNTTVSRYRYTCMFTIIVAVILYTLYTRLVNIHGIQSLVSQICPVSLKLTHVVYFSLLGVLNTVYRVISALGNFHPFTLSNSFTQSWIRSDIWRLCLQWFDLRHWNSPSLKFTL